ncbi:MAG: radical SAM protein [Deltaproteobacteria bacterium]|nr:radical SAM protein [Deltaproteobacteria bacterium]
MTLPDESRNVHLMDPRGRIVRIQDVEVEWLGSSFTSGCACLLYRMGPFDVILWVRPHEPAGSRRCFFTVGDLDASYTVFPPGGEPHAQQIEAVRTLALRFFERHPEIRGESLRSTEFASVEQVVEGVPVTGGCRARLVGVRGGALALRLDSETGDRQATCLIGPRADHGPGILGWSLQVERQGHWEQHHLDALQGYLLDVVSAIAVNLGLGSDWGQLSSPSAVVDIDLRKRGNRRVLEPDIPGDVEGRLDVRISIPSHCDQDCTYCEGRTGDAEIPPDDQVLQDIREITQRLRPLVEGGVAVNLVLLGDDVLNSPVILDVVRSLATIPPESVSFTTPGTRLADPLFARALAGSCPSLSVTLTLNGPDNATHDDVAGRQGAFKDLMRALANCREAGIGVALHHILTASTLPNLGATLEAAGVMGVPLTLVLFGTEPQYSREFVKRNLPSPELWLGALNEHRGKALKALTGTKNFPLCSLPVWARDLAVFEGATLPDDPKSTPKPCRDCGVFGEPCPGPGNGYLERLGTGWLTSL